MEEKNLNGSGNKLLSGKYMTFPECMTCTDVKHCKVELSSGEKD